MNSPKRRRYSVFLFLLFSSFLQAQNSSRYSIHNLQLAMHKAAIDTITPKDTSNRNMYGNLVIDDKDYNPRYPWYTVVSRILETHVLTWAIDRYIENADYARINLETMKTNLNSHLEWDDDRFGINFVGHPYAGSLVFNNARANGYSFYASIPFVVFSSTLWEEFGETTKPSYNDMINTPTNGLFLGEILYRLSSDILDDRTTGAERTFREIAAGLVAPTRELNRLIQGKTKRIAPKEVYQKEPVNITMYGGIQQRNIQNKEIYGAGTTNVIYNLQLDYGNAFEPRVRQPFDFFKVRIDLSFNNSRKILDNLTGYGLITGKNTTSGKIDMLSGIYQHYDYWDNNSFELGSFGVGVGTVTKYEIKENTNLYTNFHIAAVPLAGNNSRYGLVSDTSQYRDYNYCYGAETKLDATLNLGSLMIVSFSGYYYWLHSFVGLKQNNFLGILKPRIALRVFDDFHIGFEHTVHYNDNFIAALPDIHTAKTEQKIFIMLYLESSKRRGRYN